MTQTPDLLLYDSSVLILFLNDALAEASVLQLTDRLLKRRVTISSIVRAEVLAWGGHTTLSLMLATNLLDACELLPVDAMVADEAARIRRETGLKLPDALIAAAALLTSATLVSANGKDFRRVPGLLLEEI
jgi:predicted nucleic acid-binding protein